VDRVQLATPASEQRRRGVECPGAGAGVMSAALVGDVVRGAAERVHRAERSPPVVGEEPEAPVEVRRCPASEHLAVVVRGGDRVADGDGGGGHYLASHTWSLITPPPTPGGSTSDPAPGGSSFYLPHLEARVRLPHVGGCEDGAQDDAREVAVGERRPAAEDVVGDRLDAVEDREPSAREDPHLDREAAPDHAGEREAATEEVARARDLEREKAPERLVRLAPREGVPASREAVEILGGDVHPPAA